MHTVGKTYQAHRALTVAFLS